MNTKQDVMHDGINLLNNISEYQWSRIIKLINQDFKQVLNVNSLMSEQQETQGRSMLQSLMKDSFVKQQQSSLPVRILTKIDIFSFIPVPKDDAVSTRQSLIGTAVFFVLFLAYVIFDFYQFVAENPPNAQNYYTNLQNDYYTLPRFAITFMEGQKLDRCGSWEEYIKFGLTQESKQKGQQSKPRVNMNVNNFTKENNGNPNPDPILWIDDNTKSFYNILRTSSQPLFAKGLLYSTTNASYGKIKVQMCNYTNPQNNCKIQSEINQFCAGGRIFLFVQNILDTTDFSSEDDSNSPKFFIYNFFLQPKVYKRVTFNFQVVQTLVEPDYFFRFGTQKQTKLQIQSYIEQTSNVSAVVTQQGQQPLDMLGIQFQLSPQILNVKVTYRTLLDHVSMWGAFWGVLFALFALLFLTYNRKKFYKKNPQWDKFKQNNMVMSEDGQEKRNND